ncbi:hypothetical protein B2G71_17150 [Novosphingobium sp. PC22D]|uniref:nuclear transport factor 2 family protein n=1 Tax=Novosphingobium sp. PC22D TaxID=1962403 RepID=UPI000BFAB451|nr:nuclear transport factor 2 family protein [Novosphingobium sp. PC22D]PEQ11417.1 hypothetical protein B2G71_17150 [Novosphingobium sp. PC22D]
MADLARRAALTDLQLDYAFGIDSRDWARYRSVFTDIVDMDFSSWHGGTALRIPADEWVAQVRDRQSGFDGTQHLLSNHRFAFDDAGATGTAYVVARHYLNVDGEPHVQAIGGYYFHRFVSAADGWKIAACTLNFLWTQGDRNLFRHAARRWADKS